MPRPKEIVIDGEQALVEAISRHDLPQKQAELLDPTTLARDILSFRETAKATPSVDRLLLIRNQKPPYFEVLILMNDKIRISTRELTTPEDQHKLFQAELALWRSVANTEASFMHTATVYTGYLPKGSTLGRVVRMHDPQATYLGTLYK